MTTGEADGNATVWIFNMKDYRDWNDKQQLDHTSSDGTMKTPFFNIVGVDRNDSAADFCMEPSQVFHATVATKESPIPGGRVFQEFGPDSRIGALHSLGEIEDRGVLGHQAQQLGVRLLPAPAAISFVLLHAE